MSDNIDYGKLFLEMLQRHNIELKCLVCGQSPLDKDPEPFRIVSMDQIRVLPTLHLVCPRCGFVNQFSTENLLK